MIIYVLYDVSYYHTVLRWTEQRGKPVFVPMSFGLCGTEINGTLRYTV